MRETKEYDVGLPEIGSDLCVLGAGAPFSTEFHADHQRALDCGLALGAGSGRGAFTPVAQHQEICQGALA